MTTLHDLHRIATKRERADALRLSQAQGLSDIDALRVVLEVRAGQAGLAALVAARLTAQAATVARETVRAALRDAAVARRAGDNGAPAAWQAWFDGSARPNPGRCTIGAVLRGPGVTVEIAAPAGHGDSSDAEYRALIAVLDAAVAHGAVGLVVHGDSRVVIDDVTGPDAGAAPALADYRRQVHARLARLPDARLRWVPRHRNGAADALSQRAFAAPPETGPLAEV